MTTGFRLALIWLLCGTIGYVSASNMLRAASVEGTLVPVGNDSFYHARRILDTARDPSAFYEFDAKIHAPEGSWLTWPWGYDYGMAMLVRTVRAINPGVDPFKVMAYVPAVFVYINLGLLLAIATALKMRPAWALLVGLAAALSPLTQMLHGVGRVDHHFVEFTFVLLTLWLGLRFYEAPERTGRGVTLGVALGLASAFHTGLFVLQLPVVATVTLLWLRGTQFDRHTMLALAASLVVTTVLILLPSAPFRDGQFYYYTLSWFHLFVAIASAVVVAYAGWGRASVGRIVGLGVLGLLLLVPVIAQILLATEFLGGKVFKLDTVIEAMSPFRMSLAVGVQQMIKLYSGLLFLLPPIFLLAAYALFRRRPATQSFALVFTVFGVGLTLLQYRLHYFGSFAMFLVLPLCGRRLCQLRPARAPLIAAATVAVLVVAYYLPVSGALFGFYEKAWDANYVPSRYLLAGLHELCSTEPGIVLANNNDGHYIRYHTNCSVIANNFILTPQHTRKLHEVDELMALPPDQLREQRPDIRYVYVRFIAQTEPGVGGGKPLLSAAALRAANAPLVNRLLFDDQPPEGFELYREVKLDDGRGVPFGRLFRIAPSVARPEE